MRIVACFKLVPEEQDISVKSDKSLDLSKAAPKISQFDLNAVEAAVQLSAQAGNSTVVALSAGGKYLENSKARKDILSRGPDALTVIMDEKLEGVLPQTTASVLAATAKKDGFDLIICGDGSGDLYAQQVGLLMGQILNVPSINGVGKIVSTDGAKLIVERVLEDEVEVLEITLPAVISVTADINVPQIPAMKAILAAAKKPVTVYSIQDIGLGDVPAFANMVGIQAPDQTERKKLIIQGDGDDQIAAFAEQLRKVLN